jgi:hypothetical protein
MFQRINLFLFLFFPFLNFSQNFEKDLSAILNKLDSSNSVSLHVKVNAFEKKGGKILYNTTCIVEKQHEERYTKMDDMEFINSGGYDIQLDNSEKYIFIHKSTTGKKENFDIDLKSLKKYFDDEKKDIKEVKSKIKLIHEVEGIKTYQITGSPVYLELLIEIDTKNQKLKKIIYHFSDKSESSAKYIVIDYHIFKFNDSNFVFNLKNYFTVNNGKYKLNSKYSSYKLITE